MFLRVPPCMRECALKLCINLGLVSLKSVVVCISSCNVGGVCMRVCVGGLLVCEREDRTRVLENVQL